MCLRRSLPLLLIGLLVVTSTEGVWAQGEGPGAPESPDALAGRDFTYQGELRSGGGPVTAACDFQFGLWNALAAGAQVGSPQTVPNVSVANGRFTVTLNGSSQFGGRAFDGSARWLAIAVRCPAGAGGYTGLSPRQALTASPLAFALPGLRTEFSGLSSPNVVGGSLSNTVAGGVVGATIAGGGDNGAANSVTANYGAVGGGVVNTASGDVATVGGGIGNTASGDRSTVAGGDSNVASGVGATVGGGGRDGNHTSGNQALGAASTIGGGIGNTASNFATTVGGGYNNTASWPYATVGGGGVNSSGGSGATVSGGNGNSASNVAATVGGGRDNSASGEGATVGGGGWDGLGTGGNQALGDLSTIGGGNNNTASGPYATVGGGYSNTASDDSATVGGGALNTASNDGATVPGGLYNTAAGYVSFAAGYAARANHYGSFVWSCTGCANTNSPADNTFSANATGGFWFGAVSGLGPITPTIGAGNLISTSTGARLTTGGVWTNNSDRNTKTGLAPVEGGAVLAAVLDLPLYTYRYRAEGEAVRHLGPMAQDFYAAFGLGDADTSITTVDADGVALAAIQELYGVVQTKDAEFANQDARISALETRLAALETGASSRPAPSSAALPWLLLAGLGLLNVVGLAGYALARVRRG